MLFRENKFSRTFCNLSISVQCDLSLDPWSSSLKGVQVLKKFVTSTTPPSECLVTNIVLWGLKSSRKLSTWSLWRAKRLILIGFCVCNDLKEKKTTSYFIPKKQTNTKIKPKQSSEIWMFLSEIHSRDCFCMTFTNMDHIWGQMSAEMLKCKSFAVRKHKLCVYSLASLAWKVLQLSSSLTAPSSTAKQLGPPLDRGEWECVEIPVAGECQPAKKSMSHRYWLTALSVPADKWCSSKEPRANKNLAGWAPKKN